MVLKVTFLDMSGMFCGFFWYVWRQLFWYLDYANWLMQDTAMVISVGIFAFWAKSGVILLVIGLIAHKNKNMPVLLVLQGCCWLGQKTFDGHPLCIAVERQSCIWCKNATQMSDRNNQRKCSNHHESHGHHGFCYCSSGQASCEGWKRFAWYVMVCMISHICSVWTLRHTTVMMSGTNWTWLLKLVLVLQLYHTDC